MKYKSKKSCLKKIKHPFLYKPSNEIVEMANTYVDKGGMGVMDQYERDINSKSYIITKK